MKLSNSNFPLIVVFYLHREMISIPQFREEFIKGVNAAIDAKGANIITFYLPTDGEDRVECINPLIIDDTEHKEIAQTLEELRKNFGF